MLKLNVILAMTLLSDPELAHTAQKSDSDPTGMKTGSELNLLEL